MKVLRLKEILDEREMRGQDLAIAIGVTATTISNFNQGNTLPKADTLLKIAEYLDLDIRDLFYPSKPESNLQEIFTKDEAGNLKSIGFLKK